MEYWLWVIIGILILFVISLFIKIHILQKSAKEIANAFADRLTTDTNTLIDISSNDRHMQNLANAINIQLRGLRREQHRFRQGDTELKNAVTNISHDLRTPLTAICSYLDLLEQEEKSKAACRYVEVIRNRTETLTQLTEELFSYSVILTADSDRIKEPVVINSVLEDCIAAFYVQLRERGITPTIQMPESKVLRNLDRSALTRVFFNLLSNALKYSDGDLDITLSDAGEICFANTASGLDELQVGMLFDRFYTVEAARNSTGLGLAIARTLMERMNGTITADYKHSRLYIRIFFPVNI